MRITSAVGAEPAPSGVVSTLVGRWRALIDRLDAYPPALSGAFVGVTLSLVYLATASRSWVQSPDPLAALIPAWELANNGTLSLDSYEGLLPWFKEFDGRVVSDRAPGIVLFAVPFYWLLRGLGQSPIPATFAAALGTASAMVVLHLVFRRHASPAVAMGAALAAGLATSTWTVSADGLWPHGPAQLWLALALAATPRRLRLAGLLFGLAILTRPQTAVAAAVFGCALGLHCRSLRPVVEIGIGSALGAAALVAYNTVVFGSVSLTGGYGDLPVRWASSLTPAQYVEAIVGTLVSPDRGVLFLSPFLIVVALGLPAAWRRAAPEVRAAAMAGLAYILVYLMLNRFSGGENFFGYRLPLEALTLAAPLMLLSFVHWVRHHRLAREVFWPLLSIAVAVHAIGAIFHTPSYVAHGPWVGGRLAEAAAPAGGKVTAGILTAALIAGLVPAVLVRIQRPVGKGEALSPEAA